MNSLLGKIKGARDAFEVARSNFTATRDLKSASICIAQKNQMDAAAKEAVAMINALRSAKAAVEHLSYCEYPDSVDFRCDGCNAARETMKNIEQILKAE